MSVKQNGGSAGKENLSYRSLYSPARRKFLSKSPEQLTPGGRLRRERLLRKMSLEQMADFLEISPSYLGALERDKRSISRNVMDRLHARLNLSYDYLMEGLSISSAMISNFVRESSPYPTHHNLDVLLNVCTPEELESCYNLVHTYLSLNRKPDPKKPKRN